MVLRPLARDDEDEFLRLVAANTELHHPWVSLPATPEAFRDYVARYEKPDEESLLICLRETGEIVGLANISSIVRGRFQNGSLSYAAFTSGRGYMTEGVGLVLRYAFEKLRLHRIDAQIQPGNRASLRLVERLGFRKEGYSPELLYIDGAWRDHERWAVTAGMLGVEAKPHPTLPAH
ncbi:GNAT family N-acetyltransferase [Actinomadura fibrosa]|uniref:GNAT family N-acetyltransferase n=1 Tax=Actinomadura fibrosa TaxID=111802 RepID=A0ABW2XBT3_9ACTN|nr:GNAT family protein [Actinomadura fibrosa]